MKIGIIVGSVRDGRKGLDIANWVLGRAKNRTDAEYELIDLKDFELPVLTSATVPMAADRQYDSDAVTDWSRALDACDAYVIVTPEYNHGVPGALKNAIDSVGPELTGKAVGMVGYGGDGATRAVEQWRNIFANFHMVTVRQQLPISLMEEFADDGAFVPADRRTGELDALLDQLVSMAYRLAA
jgi:NAD(P)H-dependent FMN reductase